MAGLSMAILDSLARVAHGRADRGERLIGVRSQRRDGGDAHHNDQRQHDGILDGRGAIFLVDEIPHPGQNLLHRLFLSAAWRSALSTRERRTHGFAPLLYSRFAISRKHGFPPWKALTKNSSKTSKKRLKILHLLTFMSFLIFGQKSGCIRQKPRRGRPGLFL